MMNLLIFISGFISSYLVNFILLLIIDNSPKLITRNDYLNKFSDRENFHKEKFKKLINKELKKLIKKNDFLPVEIVYYYKFSERSLNELKTYIQTTLMFADYELEQIEQRNPYCKLILK